MQRWLRSGQHARAKRRAWGRACGRTRDGYTAQTRRITGQSAGLRDPVGGRLLKSRASARRLGGPALKAHCGTASLSCRSARADIAAGAETGKVAAVGSDSPSRRSFSPAGKCRQRTAKSTGALLEAGLIRGVTRPCLHSRRHHRAATRSVCPGVRPPCPKVLTAPEGSHHLSHPHPINASLRPTSPGAPTAGSLLARRPGIHFAR
jgi:hypothetical protein